MHDCTPIYQCCACGSANLKKVLDLGEQPLANSYLDSVDQEETVYPLAANVCLDCHHVQLTHAIHPDLMFKHYLYVSGTTDTLKDNMKWFVKFVEEHTGQHGRVLDIGCNDGTQLDFFKFNRWRTYGIDPAENITPTAIEKGHKVWTDYFNTESAMKLIDIQPNAIVAQNVVAHNFDAMNFLRNVRHVMTESTLFFMQISQADMIRRNEFDTCYHEHINFFNVKSLTKIAERAGLHIRDIVKTPIHGNSYIVIMSKQKRGSARIENLINIDAADGMYKTSTYDRWGSNASQLMDHMNRIIDEAKEQGKLVVGYGAAAKGVVVLNFAKPKIDFVIDDNPLKQGKFIPGTRQPIVGVSELEKYNDREILFVPLAWNFYDEIVRRIKIVRDNPNDRFLRYFPHVAVSN